MRAGDIESVGSTALMIIAALLFFTVFSTQISGFINTIKDTVGNYTAPPAQVPPGNPQVPQALNSTGAVSSAASQWFTVMTQYTPYLASAAFIALIMALGMIIGALNAKKNSEE